MTVIDQPVRAGGTTASVPRTAAPGRGGTGRRYDRAGGDPYRTGPPPPPPVGTPAHPAAGTDQATPAGTPTTVPAPGRTGTGRPPRVWIRDSPTPGPDVTRVYDGTAYHRRDAADRWVQEGTGGPGRAWPEIPGGLRVDATSEHRPAPDGSLIMDVWVISAASADGSAGQVPAAMVADAAVTTRRNRRRSARAVGRAAIKREEWVHELVDFSPAYSARWVGSDQW